jgi:hypothetical protein
VKAESFFQDEITIITHVGEDFELWHEPDPFATEQSRSHGPPRFRYVGAGFSLRKMCEFSEMQYKTVSFGCRSPQIRQSPALAVFYHTYSLQMETARRHRHSRACRLTVPVSGTDSLLSISVPPVVVQCLRIHFRIWKGSHALKRCAIPCCKENFDRAWPEMRP